MERAAFKTPNQASAASPWPAPARWAVSLLLVLQGVAVISAAFGRLPQGAYLVRSISDAFGPYYALTYQGWAYGYYAPAPAPTPIAMANLIFKDGRELSVRIPERGLFPRLRFQRQLALANQLATDAAAMRTMQGSREESLWARSYARKLCRQYGCERVEIRVQTLLIPDPDRIRDRMGSGAKGAGQGGPFDDDDERAEPKILLGEYACSDL